VNAQYVRYATQRNTIKTPAVIPMLAIEKPIAGVTIPPPAIAVISKPEI
jgi:hypothetical protein